MSVFEILLGDSRGIQWASSKNPPPSAKPVEGGFDATGKALLIAQTKIGNAILPAQTRGWLEGAFAAINGVETKVDEYNVLVAS